MLQTVGALVALTIIASSCGGDSEPQRPDGAASNSCPGEVREVRFKVLGPPGPPDLRVTPSKMEQAVYDPQASTSRTEAADLTRDEFARVAASACGATPMPGDNSSVGGNVWVEFDSTAGSRRVDLTGAGDRLSQVPVIRLFDDLTRQHFKRGVLRPYT